MFGEVFYDSPATPDEALAAEVHEGEYIVLFNGSDELLDLSGWKIVNEENNQVQLLNGLPELKSGGHLLLGHHAEVQARVNAFLRQYAAGAK